MWSLRKCRGEEMNLVLGVRSAETENQQKQRTAYRHWVSYFSHGCDGISITNSLRKERFILAHSLKMQSIMVRKGRRQEQEAVGHIVSQSGSRGGCMRGALSQSHL